jgi:hypothetical protein
MRALVGSYAHAILYFVRGVQDQYVPWRHALDNLGLKSVGLSLADTLRSGTTIKHAEDAPVVSTRKSTPEGTLTTSSASATTIRASIRYRSPSASRCCVGSVKSAITLTRCCQSSSGQSASMTPCRPNGSVATGRQHLHQSFMACPVSQKPAILVVTAVCYSLHRSLLLSATAWRQRRIVPESCVANLPDSDDSCWPWKAVDR